jgi:putative SOS response-associated peptidase YedK
MCGRFVVNQSVKSALPALLADFEVVDNYNLAPTDDVLAVRDWREGREAPLVHWGFVPSWAKSMKQRPQPINAKIETVSTSGMFRNAFAKSRCIVPAAGYYEWTVLPDGSKQPHYIFDPEKAIAMAGIVGAWRDPAFDDDDPLRWKLSMAIITRDSHVAPGEVHDRMPACLTPDAFDDWLSKDLDADSALAILDRESLEVAAELTHYEVSKDVNSVRNTGPQLIDPLP